MVWLRAIELPPTQDEVNTFFEFVLPFHFDPFSPPYSANNHVLNTFLSGIFVRLFGHDLIWLRMANVLSFPLFAIGLWRLTRSLFPVLRWVLIFALAGNYFLFEFFSFARGYGLSMAFLILHFSYLKDYIDEQSKKGLWRASAFLTLAVMANQTLTTYALGLTVFVVLKEAILHRRIKSTIGPVILLVLISILAALSGLRLQSEGELYFGSGEGFVQTTFYSLLNTFRLGPSTRVFVITLLLSAASVVSLIQFKRWKDVFNESRITFPIFLVALILAAITMNIFLGVNYPYERAALYFVPFFWLAACFSINSLHSRMVKLTVAAIALGVALYFPLDFYRQFNSSYSNAEPFGNLPIKFYEKIVEHSSEHSVSSPVIAGPPQMHFAWQFYDYQDTASCSRYQTDLKNSDYFISYERIHDLAVLDSARSPIGTLYLYQSEKPQPEKSFFWSKEGIEFSDEYVSPIGALNLEKGRWQIEVYARFSGINEKPKLHLSIKHKNLADSYGIDIGRKINLDQCEMDVSAKYYVRVDSNRSNPIVYFWNPKKETYHIENLRIKASRI